MKKPPFYKSLYYATKGLLWLMRNERNFQLELLGLFINIILIVVLSLKTTDAVAILGVSFLVLICEAFNTAIEKICDYLQPDFDVKISIIKDIAAAAVWLSALLALLTGLLIYSKYLL